MGNAEIQTHSIRPLNCSFLSRAITASFHKEGVEGTFQHSNPILVTDFPKKMMGPYQRTLKRKHLPSLPNWRKLPGLDLSEKKFRPDYCKTHYSKPIQTALQPDQTQVPQFASPPQKNHHSASLVASPSNRRKSWKKLARAQARPFAINDNPKSQNPNQSYVLYSTEANAHISHANSSSMTMENCQIFYFASQETAVVAGQGPQVDQWAL